MTTGNSRPRRRLRRSNTPKALRQERQSSMTSYYENREDKAGGWRVPGFIWWPRQIPASAKYYDKRPARLR
jgi:hypothetical protein